MQRSARGAFVLRDDAAGATREGEAPAEPGAWLWLARTLAPLL